MNVALSTFTVTSIRPLPFLSVTVIFTVALASVIGNAVQLAEIIGSWAYLSSYFVRKRLGLVRRVASPCRR